MDTLISEKVLRTFIESVFEHEGFPLADAKAIADVLMLADLFGIESHGAQRMMYYHQNIRSGSVDAQAQIETVRETPVSALLDAHFAKSESKLKTARKHRGLTQEALANESGVSLNTIRAYERKSKDLNKAQFEIVMRLAKALKCDVSELLE